MAWEDPLKGQIVVGCTRCGHHMMKEDSFTYPPVTADDEVVVLCSSCLVELRIFLKGAKLSRSRKKVGKHERKV